MRFSLIILVLAAGLHAQEIGRYQIITSSLSDGSTAVPLTLRIDTTTGKTWQLVSYPVESLTTNGYPTTVVGWMPIPENPVQIANEINGHIATNSIPRAPIPKAFWEK